MDTGAALRFEDLYNTLARPLTREESIALPSTPQGGICNLCDGEDPFEDLVKLGCRHHFGGRCIRSWLSTQETCPRCRTRLYVMNPAMDPVAGENHGITWTIQCDEDIEDQLSEEDRDEIPGDPVVEARHDMRWNGFIPRLNDDHMLLVLRRLFRDW